MLTSSSTAAVGLALVLCASACGGTTIANGEVVPDFSLKDANPTSASFGKAVSPRDFISQGSAWYFGHAT